MLSKKLNYIIFFLILSLSIFLIWSSNNINTSNEYIYNIDDVSLIDKIFLADRNGNTITLLKNNSSWIVNDKYIVRKDALSTLLSTAKMIRINSPVSKSAFNNVIKFMSTSGVFVEFYEGSDLIKSYTIGSNTPDHLSTYMLLDKSKTPHSVHIPSFNGFLSPRYGITGNSINENNWRSHSVFSYPSDSINFVSYTDYLNPANSFKLNVNPFILSDNKSKLVSFNNKSVLNFLNNFKNINCEAFKLNTDGIDLSNKIEQIIVNSDTLTTYQISDEYSIQKKDRSTVKRKYAILNNGGVMLIQNYVFNKVLISIDELKQ